MQLNSLLPVEANLTAVNLNEAHIEDTVARYEPMKVRLRIDAPGNPANVRFLQVLQASDAGVPIVTPTLIQSTDVAWQGAQIGTTVVLFAAELGRNFSSLSYSFAAPVSTHLISGLPPNSAFCVTLIADRLSLKAGCDHFSDGGGVLNYSATTGATQVITGFAPSSPVVLGTAPVNLSATGGASGQPVVFATTSQNTICTVQNSIVTFTGVGVCNLTANQAAAGNYSAAQQVVVSITITEMGQTIGTIGFNPTSLNVGGTSAASATATSGLPASFFEHHTHGLHS